MLKAMKEESRATTHTGDKKDTAPASRSALPQTTSRGDALQKLVGD
jgi:hypothetical protein